MIITTTPDVDQTILVTGHPVVPLRAVAHLRKGGFVIESLDACLDSNGTHEEPSSETSLRLLHSGRVALIAGERHKLSPQVYRFLSVLETASGEPVHKRRLADELDIAVDRCKGVDIFHGRNIEGCGSFLSKHKAGNSNCGAWLGFEFSSSFEN